MIVTNRLYDLGFPFRIIQISKYMKLMRDIFKEDLDKCFVGFTRNEHADMCFCELEPPLERKLERPPTKSHTDGLNELDSLSDKAEVHPTKDKIVTTKSLKRLERWFESYMDKHQDQELGSPDSD